MYKLFALCAISTLVSTAARAATTTYNISVVGFPTSLSGSFTLTFDPTQTYLTDTAAGLTVKSLSFTAGPSAFLYVPTSFGGVLTIGGQLNGVSANQTGTNDYTLQIRDLLSNPVLTGFTVNQV